MIPIQNSELRRLAPRNLFDALEDAQQAMSQLATEKEKRDYIDAHSDVYSQLRQWLWQTGHLKCWYSEAKLPEGVGEVEHFRPKRLVWKSQPPHSGYLWLAFDWRNLRLAHPLVNKRRPDYSTKQMAGKGCYFPLLREELRARVPGAEEQEDPVLLDPVVPHDCTLICFDENGKPIPRLSKENDAWQHRRAADSINYYHLDEGTWNADRADLMREVGVACERVLAAAAEKDQVEYKRLIGELFGYIDPYAEFSAAAAQVISEKGLWGHLHPTAPRNAVPVEGAQGPE
jgi:hypothetical protein